MIISSLKNQRVKDVVRLRQRRARDQEGLMLIEGYRGIRRAVDNDFAIADLYISPPLFLGDNNGALIDAARQRGIAVTETSEEVFHKLSYRDRPDGLLAVAPQFPSGLAVLPPPKTDAFYLVAEAIEKPGNLGTMLRSADAAGCDAVIVGDPRTDIYNPNVVRASIGTLFSVPVAQVATAAVIAWLSERGIRLVAATPHTDQIYTETDLSGPIAVATGAEQYGLSDEFLAAADIHVRIPMCGQADSLNVASATTLLLYEVLRQRRQ